MSTPGKSLFTMVVPSSIRNSRSRTPLLNSNSLILAAPSRPCTCWFMSGLGHVCEMHKVKEKYIEDIQWFDVEYGIYFTSKTGFFFLYFHECKIIRKSCLTIERNSIFDGKSLNTQFITFSLECEQDFFSNLRHCMQKLRHKSLLF